MQYAASILEGCSALEEGLFLVAIEIIGFFPDGHFKMPHPGDGFQCTNLDSHVSFLT